MRAIKFSINISANVGFRLRDTAFDERLSESSIVEVALTELFAGVPREDLGNFLRKHGAVLRRPSDNT